MKLDQIQTDKLRNQGLAFGKKGVYASYDSLPFSPVLFSPVCRSEQNCYGLVEIRNSSGQRRLKRDD